MKRSYLDWAASAPVHPVAKEAAIDALDVVGNPSSAHREGQAARAWVERAREQVAALVGCETSEVVFTGSGSEANALALLGQGEARKLALGSLEHASLRLAAESASRRGAQVCHLPSTSSGVVDPEAARALVAGGVDFVAIQAVNNETGVMQPVAAIAGVAAEAGAHLHCDAVQAAGKLDLEPVWARCHSLSLSAHKIGGLAGVGALILRQGVELRTLIPGHQERGRRGGTPSVPAIAAFGAAAELALRERELRDARSRELSAELERIIQEACPDARILGAEAERVPGIVSVCFPSRDGQLLLMALDLAGVACSHGAACSTGAIEPSHVPLAMGLSAAEARSTLRFSVGPETSDAELALLRRVLPDALRAAAL